jgi:hypothetical protein
MLGMEMQLAGQRKVFEMAQTLASDMVQKSLAVFSDRVQRQQLFSAAEARELLAGCPILFLSLEKLWELAQGFLDRGMESKRMIFLLKECADLLDWGIQALSKATERVEASELSADEKTEGEALLERARLQALEWRNELSKLVHRLETPPRPVDPAMLPGGRGDREAKGYVGLDEMTAHLISPKKP